MKQPSVCLGISKHFHNKENNAPLKTYSDGLQDNKWAFGRFDSVEWTPEQITKHILSGKAICVAYTNKNWRSKKNFISSQIMGVDFDLGPSVSILAEDPFIKRYAFLVYATPKSTPEKPRSRALFLLDKPITDPDRYQNLVRRLLARFDVKIDESCTDSARLFFGSDTKDHLISDQNVLPTEILEALPMHVLEKRSHQMLEGNVNLDDPNDVEELRQYAYNVYQKVLRELPETPEGDRHHAIVNAVTKLVGMEISGYPLDSSWKDEFISVAKSILPTSRKQEVEQVLNWGYENLEPSPLFLPNKNPIEVVIDDERTNVLDSIQSHGPSNDTPSNISGNKESKKTLKLESYLDRVQRFQDYKTEWLVDKWLVKGSVGIMAAPPQRYKTWIAADLALSISTGNPFLGQFEVFDPGHVMVIQQEDSKKALIERFQWIDASYYARYPTEVSDNGNGYYVKFNRLTQYMPYFTPDEYTFSFDDPNSVILLREFVKVLKPKLVIIDPLYSISGEIDKYYAGLGEQIRAKIKPIREEFDTTFLIIHHTKKTQNGESDSMNVNQIFGSNILRAAFESTIMVGQLKARNPNVITVHRHFKYDESQIPIQLEFKIDKNRDNMSDRYHVSVGEASEQDQKILIIATYLETHGPSKLATMLEEFSDFFSNTKRLSEFLNRHDKYFVSEKHGYWQNTPDSGKVE